MKSEGISFGDADNVHPKLNGPMIKACHWENAGFQDMAFQY
jgi:hypothetical protein